MRRILTKAALFARRLSRTGAQNWRRLSVALLYPSVRLGRNVVIGRAVTLAATDGGSIEIGAGVNLGDFVVVVARRGRLIIGANGHVGEGSVIVARDRVTIGDDALIAEHVTIRDQDHGSKPGRESFRLQPFVTAPVTIGRNVWLGAKACVLKGVTIGDDAILGAGAVATRDIAVGARAVGIPARAVSSPQPTMGPGRRGTRDA